MEASAPQVLEDGDRGSLHPARTARESAVPSAQTEPALSADRQTHKLRGLLRGASIIVGMHPDQATEPIVAAALALGKPFAVVPCWCVRATTVATEFAGMGTR
jgi:hypothetical protein|eukprot:COSAG01_NODE_4398_length_5066_cov_52.758204_6_plen_103_part_00